MTSLRTWGIALALACASAGALAADVVPGPEVYGPPMPPAISDASMSVVGPAVITEPAKPSAEDKGFIEILTQTYQTNPRILSERERQENTDEQIAEALSNLRPNLGFTIDEGKQNTRYLNFPWVASPSSDKELRLEQPLFRGGGTYASWMAAKQRVQAGQFELSSVEQQVLLQTITAYMDVVANAEIVEAAKSNVDVLDKQVGGTNERFKYGEVTRADVAQAQASLADARAQFASAQYSLASSIAQFGHLVGARPGSIHAPDAMPELPQTLDQALDEARRTNPKLLEALRGEQASHYDVRTNESVLLPQVSLIGTVNRQRGVGTFGTDELAQNQIGVQMTVPIYQQGLEYAKIREARATERQRKYESQDTKLSIEQSVEQSWEQYASATVAADMRAQQITAAKTQLEGMRAEAGAGNRTVFDVLEAQQTLFNAQISEATAKHDRMVSAFNLLYNLGQLTPENLGLPVASYDPTKHLHHVQWLPAGF